MSSTESYRGGRRNNRGAGIPEAALSLPVLFALLFVLLSLVLAFFLQGVLKIAVNEGATALVRLHLQPGFTREEIVRDRVIATANRFGVVLLPQQITICPLGQTCQGANNAGRPSDLIQIRATYPINQLIGFGSISLQVRSIGRNPAFFLSQ